MSLLDDAIRQHLDLKRKHGASEDELRELESEAFGPATRPGEEEPADAGGFFDAEAPTEFLGEAGGAETALEPPPPSGTDLDETTVLGRGFPRGGRSPPGRPEDGGGGKKGRLCGW